MIKRPGIYRRLVAFAGVLVFPSLVSAQGFDTGRDPLTPTDKFNAEVGYLSFPQEAKEFRLSLMDGSYLGPNRELLVQLELPVEHFRPGTGGGGTHTGLGDVIVAFGHVFFGGSLSQLLQVGGVLNTATNDSLGQNRWVIAPTYGISWMASDWFTQVILTDWERSLSEESGAIPRNRLVFRTRSILKLPSGIYSSVETTPFVDFKRDGKAGISLGGRLGIMLGESQIMGFFAQVDRPFDSYSRSVEARFSASLGFEIVAPRGEAAEE